MKDNKENDPIDLGSDSAVEFDPWANDDELDVEVADEVKVNTPTQQPVEAKAQAQKRTKAAASTDSITESGNPLANAVDAAETEDAVKAKQDSIKKLPVFEFAGASEEIADSSLTFDELRIAKAADFPELEDGKRVTWTVEYGKITKEIADAKGTSIAKIKSDIETSKAFLDALKKATDKNPVCKVKPRVKAQTKGTASGYKGVFANMKEVEAGGKVISFLPAKDGHVYEVRKNAMGTFITTVTGCDLLSDVKAGFTPASGIPLIPMDLTMRIIAFFRYFTQQDGNSEALVNIYWDTLGKAFVVDTPPQVVSMVSVHSEENPDYIDERYIHYMDIHSHNTMRAFFSATDNNDEKATRLYSVMGRMDNFFPEIRTRISNGGKFLEIDPAEVFEYVARPFPPEWKDNVKLRAAHSDIDCDDTTIAKGRDKLELLWNI